MTFIHFGELGKPARGTYYVALDYETGMALRLKGRKGDGEYVCADVHRILDMRGETLHHVNMSFRFKTEYYTGAKDQPCLGALFPDDLTHDFGPRVGEHLDFTLTRLERPDSLGGPIDIFPKVFRVAPFSVRPKDAPPNVDKPNGVLIEKRFQDPFFAKLVTEINQAHSFGLRRPAMVLFRLLLESLVVELLRAKYKPTVEAFYDTNKRRFREFSVLIQRLNDEIADIRPMAPGLSDKELSVLDSFRARGNASAHVLEDDVTPKELDDRRAEMTRLCELLARAVEQFRGSPL